MNKKNVKKNIFLYASLIFFMILVSTIYSTLNTKVNKISFDEFIGENSSKIEKIVIIPQIEKGIYEIKGRFKDYKNNEYFIVNAPYSDGVMNKILELQVKNKFKINATYEDNNELLKLIIINVVPIAIILGAAYWFLNKQSAGVGKSFDFAKSKARLYENKKRITFKEVAGLDEEKEEVNEIIEFLKYPKKFEKMGARIPKGVLLVGPPGTGKTLLARAIAGEANAPFFYISGSDFTELYVGVGASRVRDMFKDAKLASPCLIFIDEIDVIGRQRGAGLGGGHDEREQTLNQLLTEMDGFESNEGVIIIAATNRPDVLDPALLRPGRFDRQVQVNLPDQKGRKEILEVHARNKSFAKNVKLENVAKRTVGFSGADLENLLNEAAILAVREDKNLISMTEIDEAHDRVLMGPAKKSHKYTEKEMRTVAYHEAGHAVMGIVLDGANVVQKITIIPRGMTGGYNLMLPKEETFLSTKNELYESICGLLGGRAAEELTFKEVTTGAHNDFEKATKIARAMVTEYGMSSLGLVQLEQLEGSVFLGRDYAKTKNYSTQVAFEIDQEIKKIIDECYEKAKNVITENKELLDLIANSLLEKETLTKEEIDYLVKNKCLPDETESSQTKKIFYETMSLTELKEEAKKAGIVGFTKMTKEELVKKLEEI